MNVVTQYTKLRPSERPDRRVGKCRLRRLPRGRVEEFPLRVEHQPEAGPADRAAVQLRVRGPARRAAAVDHTAPAAVAEGPAPLRTGAMHGPARRLRRHRRPTRSRPPGRVAGSRS